MSVASHRHKSIRTTRPDKPELCARKSNNWVSISFNFYLWSNLCICSATPPESIEEKKKQKCYNRRKNCFFGLFNQSGISYRLDGFEYFPVAKHNTFRGKGIHWFPFSFELDYISFHFLFCFCVSYGSNLGYLCNKWAVKIHVDIIDKKKISNGNLSNKYTSMCVMKMNIRWRKVPVHTSSE